MGTPSLGYITVAASENPYGVFSMSGSLSRVVEEGVGNITVPIVRNMGTLSGVTVAFTINGEQQQQGGISLLLKGVSKVFDLPGCVSFVRFIHRLFWPLIPLSHVHYAHPYR